MSPIADGRGRALLHLRLVPRRASAFALLAGLFAAMTSTARADARGDAVLAHARSVEKQQLQALAGVTMTMRTLGTVRDGRATHTLEALRTLAVDGAGKIYNTYVRGQFDGRTLDEEALRAATGAPKKPRHQAEALTVALAPLSDGEVDVEPAGPVAGGGYLLRCRVRRSAAVDELQLVVDEASGKKRSATLRPAGTLVKLARRADMALIYGSDGAPAELRSQFAAHILWVDRAADLTTTRLPPKND